MMNNKPITSCIRIHLGSGVHDVLCIGEMHRNDTQHHSPLDDSDSFISLLLILLCCLVWLLTCRISCLLTCFCPWHLTLFPQLIYVIVLHWMVRLYYYGFLVNEVIDLIVIMYAFPSSTLRVLYKLRCLSNLFCCIIHYFSFKYTQVTYVVWSHAMHPLSPRSTFFYPLDNV